MRTSKISIVLLLACAGLLGARSGDVSEYNGDALSSEDGLVVLRVMRHQSTSGANSLAMSRELKDLMAVLISADGKQRLTVSNIDQVRAFVLPAGRWYVSELRTPRERDWPKIVTKEQAKLRSFEVLGGSVNYAGVYDVQFVLDSEGRQSVNVNVEYGPELVKEAADAFPQAFAAMPLVYCPLGRKCKPPSEFKY